MGVNRGFDAVAHIYDALSFMVFGKNLQKAQAIFLDRLPSHGTVLIIGGGTGWILKEVINRREELRVDYVEASAEMLRLSQKQVLNHRHITFIHGLEKDIPAGDYDCIITNFFLDVFSEEHLAEVMRLLRSKLSQEGVWLCTDFRAGSKRSHQLLIWLMHRFFRLFASLEAKRLLDFRPYFARVNMKLEEEAELSRGLIFSAVYRPTE